MGLGSVAGKNSCLVVLGMSANLTLGMVSDHLANSLNTITFFSC